MLDNPVLWNIDARGVARVTLNRPEVNNAYDGALIQGLHDALDALGGDAALRAVVIAGNGKHFQAGADLAWLNALRAGSPQENESASRATAMAVGQAAGAVGARNELREPVRAPWTAPHHPSSRTRRSPASSPCDLRLLSLCGTAGGGAAQIRDQAAGAQPMGRNPVSAMPPLAVTRGLASRTG